MTSETGPKEWRVIPSHPLYLASSEGDIYSIRTGKILVPSVKRTGYLGYTLSVDGVLYYPSGHRLVCEAFNGAPPPGKRNTLHYNGIRDDNRSSNLRWGSQTENLQDRARHGNCHESNKTQCPQGHEYSPENTYISQGSRKCKICVRVRSVAYRKRVIAQGIPDDSRHHGTTRGYNGFGCRCDSCRAAHTDYHRNRRNRTIHEKENNND